MKKDITTAVFFRAVLLTLAVLVILFCQTASASAKAKVIKPSLSQVYAVGAEGVDSPPALRSQTKYAYSGGKLAKETTTYYYSMSKPTTVYTKKLYSKGQLMSEINRDRFGITYRMNYAYKGKKVVKSVYYTKTKKQTKYVKRKIITYKYSKTKLTKTEKKPNGKKLSTKTIVLYDSKGRVKKETNYIDNEPDTWVIYKYYKNGNLKSRKDGDEYGAVTETFDKYTGLLISTLTENYDEGEEPSEKTYAYSNFYNGDERYPQDVVIYTNGVRTGKEIRTYGEF